MARHVALSTRIHYPDSEPTSLCSYSLVVSEEAPNTNFIVFGLTLHVVLGIHMTPF
jgi:hypothetical protein